MFSNTARAAASARDRYETKGRQEEGVEAGRRSCPLGAARQESEELSGRASSSPPSLPPPTSSPAVARLSLRSFFFLLTHPPALSFVAFFSQVCFLFSRKFHPFEMIMGKISGMTPSPFLPFREGGGGNTRNQGSTGNWGCISETRQISKLA